VEDFADPTRNEAIDSDALRFCRLIAKILLRTEIEKKASRLKRHINEVENLKNIKGNSYEQIFNKENFPSD
jgi:hypothetical protein